MASRKFNIKGTRKRIDYPKFQFSNVVVVEDSLIGCIVKTWRNSNKVVNYEVYVRSYNCIKEYDESETKHFVYDKELENN